MAAQSESLFEASGCIAERERGSEGRVGVLTEVSRKGEGRGGAESEVWWIHTKLCWLQHQ